MSPLEVDRLLSESEWLQRLARRLLGDGPDAEDLVQETWLRALQSRRRGARQRGWLATIARNITRELGRADDRRRAREADAARPEAVDASALEQAQLRRDVLDLVLDLPEPERTAVVLRTLEGLPYEEVARRQGSSVTAARKRVSRGIERLRARLDRQPGGRESWAVALAPFAGVELVGATSTSLLTGVFAMNAKLAASLGALLALAALFVMWPVDGQSPTGLAGHDAAPREVDDDVPMSSASDAPPTRRDATVAAVAEATAPAAQPAFPALPAAEGGSLRLRLTWSDGTSAVGVPVRLVPWGSRGDARRETRLVTTGAGGEVLAQALPPGRVGIYVAPGGNGSVAVAAGRVTVHDLRIPAGVLLHGQVLDPDGAPVGAATVYLSDYGSTGVGVALTRTDAAGRYEARDVGKGHWLSARAPGFGPSSQHRISGAPGRELELDLVLRGPGASLSGVVLDPDGLPLAGARVSVREPAPEGERNLAGVTVKPLPVEMRSDEDGRFAQLDVGAGSVTVFASAAGLVRGDQTVILAPGEQGEVEVRLGQGGVLEGTVRHEDGRPGAGATVSVGRTSARVQSDGSYRVAGVIPGEQDVQAHLQDEGEATGRVRIVSGRPVRWDGVLRAGDALRGQVRDERGLPLAYWVVGVTGGGGGWLVSTRAQEDGRFTLRDLPEGHTTLAVGPPDAVLRGPALLLPGVLPRESELVVVVPDDALSTATLRMRVLVDGAPAAADTVVVIRTHAPFHYRELHPDEEGVACSPAIRPGEVTVMVMAPGLARWQSRVLLEPEREVDLGDVTLSAGGRIELHLNAGSEPPLIQARIIDEVGAALATFTVEGGVGLSQPVQPGPVRVLVSGRDIAARVLEGNVVEGEILVLEPDLQPGTQRTILTRTLDGSPYPMGSVMWVQRQGSPLRRRYAGLGSRDSASMRKWIDGLEVGTYLVEIETSDGRRGAGKFTVPSLTLQVEAALEVVVE